MWETFKIFWNCSKHSTCYKIFLSLSLKYFLAIILNIVSRIFYIFLQYSLKYFRLQSNGQYGLDQLSKQWVATFATLRLAGCSKYLIKYLRPTMPKQIFEANDVKYLSTMSNIWGQPCQIFEANDAKANIWGKLLKLLATMSTIRGQRWQTFEANNVNANVCDNDHFVLGVQLKLRVFDVNHDILNDHDWCYQPSAVLPEFLVRMKAIIMSMMSVMTINMVMLILPTTMLMMLVMTMTMMMMMAVMITTMVMAI